MPASARKRARTSFVGARSRARRPRSATSRWVSPPRSRSGSGGRPGVQWPAIWARISQGGEALVSREARVRRRSKMQQTQRGVGDLVGRESLRWITPARPSPARSSESRRQRPLPGRLSTSGSLRSKSSSRRPVRGSGRREARGALTVRPTLVRRSPCRALSEADGGVYPRVSRIGRLCHCAMG